MPVDVSTQVEMVKTNEAQIDDIIKRIDSMSESIRSGEVVLRQYEKEAFANVERVDQETETDENTT